MKQENLAAELGISHQAVSKIEQSADVEEDALKRVAAILGITADAIKNFSDEAVVNYLNTFNDSSVNHGPFGNYHCTFNPLDKLIEMVEENKNYMSNFLPANAKKLKY